MVKDSNINGAVFEWGLIEPLQTELYEAMMDNESEEVIKLTNKIKFRLLEIQRMYKQEEL